MKKLSFWLMILIFTATASFCQVQDDSPWLLYRNKDNERRGLTEIKFIDDRAIVILEGYITGRSEYETTLSEKERSDLVNLIHSTNFFSESTPSDLNTSHFVGWHGGLTEISVDLNDKHHTVKFYANESLEQLVRHLWLIINQADILNDFKRERSPHEIAAAVSPMLTGAEVLQPQVFKEPLKAFINETMKVDTTTWTAFKALSWITEVEEFVQYFKMYFDDSSLERRSKLLYMLTRNEFIDGIPDAHKRGLLSLFSQE